MDKPHDKKVPSYWWDFVHRKDYIQWIIIESDDDKYPVVAKFAINNNYDYCTPIIEKCERIIKELNEGRLTPKQCIYYFYNTNGDI